MKTIRKAIFPVAGLGTRFLPATKATPKEMLPIVDKPLIQYAVEEAVRAGIRDLVFVTSGSKRTIEDHFDSNYELEMWLHEKQKTELLESLQNILPDNAHCIYLRQSRPLGLGHAILCAEPVVGDEPFAVLLADDLIEESSHKLCLQQMVAEYNNHQKQGSIIAVQAVPMSDVHKYGIVAIERFEQNFALVNNIVEKPTPEKAPSNFAAIGRYVLNPSIFEHLKKMQLGHGDEIQLTDAIAKQVKAESVYAYQFEGTRYDCGNKLGYLQASIEYGLKHPELGEDFKDYLKVLAEKI